MHYGAEMFSKNGRDTITSKNGESIGQRDGASESDIEQIRLLYQCRSGPRDLTSYKENTCTDDCPCWDGANGCGDNSTCQGDLICKDGQCVGGMGEKRVLSRSRRKRIGIITGAVAGATSLAMFAVFCSIYRKRTRQRTKMEYDTGRDLSQHLIENNDQEP